MTRMYLQSKKVLKSLISSKWIGKNLSRKYNVIQEVNKEIHRIIYIYVLTYLVLGLQLNRMTQIETFGWQQNQSVEVRARQTLYSRSKIDENVGVKQKSELNFLTSTAHLQSLISVSLSHWNFCIFFEKLLIKRQSWIKSRISDLVTLTLYNPHHRFLEQKLAIYCA